MIRLLASPTRLQLGFEFGLLFVGIPILMLVFFGQYSLFLTVWILAALSLGLLWMTPGFEMRHLLRGFGRRGWWTILWFSTATLVTCLAVATALVPGRIFAMPLYRPELWLMIMLLYPPLSAWPQEVIYRSLFFERYGGLFPSAGVAIAMNALAFGMGHLFFQNPVTIAMTAIAGGIMGWAYLNGRSLLLAWLLHSLAGMIVFTTGLGIFFYHGAIGATP